MMRQNSPKTAPAAASLTKGPAMARFLRRSTPRPQSCRARRLSESSHRAGNVGRTAAGTRAASRYRRRRDSLLAPLAAPPVPN